MRLKSGYFAINMSSTSESTRNEENAQPVRLTSELRIDAPHFVCMSPDFSLGPVAAHSESSTPELSTADPPAIPLAGKRERLQRHANELAAKLESRCRDLDHREAQLNTRCAEFEQEVRSARLWISEKQVELREREEQLKAETQKLAQATASRPQEVQACSCQSPEGEAIGQAELTKRCEELKRVEHRLRDARVQLEECRAQLIQKRAEFDAHVTEQRKLFENYQNDVETELDQRRKKLDNQARANEQIRVILERCRKEVEQKHRDTLQLRLATEELWVRMSDGAPSTAMLQSLSKIRSRLADEYRAAEARLANG